MQEMYDHPRGASLEACKGLLDSAGWDPQEVEAMADDGLITEQERAIMLALIDNNNNN
jgi:hypothetical protein